MAKTIDFNTLVQMNQLLKVKGIEYSLQSLGGCTFSGMELRQDGKVSNIEDIVEILNDFLKDKWMRVEVDPVNSSILNVK